MTPIDPTPVGRSRGVEEPFGWLAVVRGLVRDPWVRAITASLALCVVVALVLDGPTRAFWAGRTAPLLHLLLLVGVLWSTAGFRPQREKRFWRMLAGAGLAWWLGVLWGMIGGPHVSVAESLWIDTAFAGTYLALLWALATRPHEAEIDPDPAAQSSLETVTPAADPRVERVLLPSRRPPLLDVAADTVLIAALFGYCILLPAYTQPEAYLSGTPSLLFDIVADLLLAVRFFRVSAGTRTFDRRWSLIYRILACVYSLFFCLDLVHWCEAAHGLQGLPRWTLDLLWLAVATAWIAPVRIGIRTDSQRRRDPWPLSIDSPLRYYGFALPILYTASIVFGEAEPSPAGAAIILTALLILGALAALEQTTERLRRTFLEEATRSSALEAKRRDFQLNSLIEHSPMAIVVLDADHRVQLVNPAFHDLFGYRPDEVADVPLDDLISTDQTASEAAEYTKKVQRGDTVHKFARRRRKDGSEVEVEIHGVPLVVDGELKGIYAIYQDVTDRLEAEEALRESEERFRRLSDATFEGIVLSENQQIVDCNLQFGQLVGAPTESLIGRRVLDFVADEDRKIVAMRLREGYEQPYEHRLLSSDGQVRRVEVRARSIPFRGREVRVAAVHDVTESRKFEDRVRQAQKMEAVGRLAGGIAHDFNNVLTVIKGYSQLLSFQVAGRPEAHHVEEIRQAADRAGLMTQRLLAFGRKQAVQSQILDLGRVIGGMEDMLRRLIRADIEFAIDTPEGQGLVRADPGQLEQVILNLVINARDAMPRGGTLRVRSQRIEIAASAPGVSPGSYIQLEVADTGVGMDEKTQTQIFEPFFTTKPKEKGTGLGLATVYAIVQQNEGAIEVESEVDQGTRFRVLFPRIAGEIDDDVESPTLASLPVGQERIWVVEDEPGVRDLAVEFLASYGYEVKQSPDGADALKHLEAIDGDIDLLLTDIVMPGMNGTDLAEEVGRRWPQVRTLFMSGYTDEALEWNERTVGARLVQKPFSVEDLVNKVREVLDETPTTAVAIADSLALTRRPVDEEVS